MPSNIKTLIFSRLPCLQWFRSYDKDQLSSDAIAGFTVGLTVIPQSLAYADLAGLPVQYGLYSSFMGSLLYTFLGTSKDITLGPTAIMALLISEYCQNSYGDSTSGSDPVLSTLLCFLAGFILLLMAILNVGFLVNFIPHPVIVGFCCSAAVLISSSQVKNLLGLTAKIPKPFFDQWKGIFENLNTLGYKDFILGLCSLLILKTLQICKEKYCNAAEDDSSGKKVAKKVLWFCATARNAIVVIIATVIAFSVTTDKENFKGPLRLTGKLKEGLPSFGLPAFSRMVPAMDVTTGKKVVDNDDKLCYPFCNEPHHLDYAELYVECLEDDKVKSDNTTIGIEKVVEKETDVKSVRKRSIDKSTISEDKCHPTYENKYKATLSTLIGKISSGMAVIPIMAYLESVAIAKGFSKKFGYKVDATQELYAISICCIATSLFSGFPVTGSFSRSAVNAASGVATPAGGIVTAFMVIMSSLFLTPVFAYVPKAALSAVIFLAAVSMFDSNGVKHVYQLRRADCIPLIVTFLLCFYEVAIGICAGVIVALLIMLNSHAKPKLLIDKFDDRGLVVRFDRNLDYPACDYVESKISEKRFDDQEFLIIDLERFITIDSCAAEQLFEMTKLKNIDTGNKLDVFFTSAVKTRVKETLIKAGVDENDIFSESYEAVLIKKSYHHPNRAHSLVSLTNVKTKNNFNCGPQSDGYNIQGAENYSTLVQNICMRELSESQSRFRGGSESNDRSQGKHLVDHV